MAHPNEKIDRKLNVTGNTISERILFLLFLIRLQLDRKGDGETVCGLCREAQRPTLQLWAEPLAYIRPIPVALPFSALGCGAHFLLCFEFAHGTKVLALSPLHIPFIRMMLTTNSDLVAYSLRIPSIRIQPHDLEYTGVLTQSCGLIISRLVASSMIVPIKILPGVELGCK